LTTLLAFNSPDGGFPYDDIRKIFHGWQRMAKVPNGIETLPKISGTRVRLTNFTNHRWMDDSV